MSNKIESSELPYIFLSRFVLNLSLNALKIKRGMQLIDDKISKLDKINAIEKKLSSPVQIPVQVANQKVTPVNKITEIKAQNPVKPVQFRQLNRVAVPQRTMVRQFRPQVPQRKVNPIQQIPQNPVKPAAPTTQNNFVIMGMEKINSFLTDPSVNSIECPGPERPLLVNKGGMIQATSIILTTEEINKILGEISQKTKIPLIPGVFRTALGNYIITAIISEFVGTRFSIQKKNPFHQI